MNTAQCALNIYANILFAASISIIKCETKTKQGSEKKGKVMQKSGPAENAQKKLQENMCGQEKSQRQKAAAT